MQFTGHLSQLDAYYLERREITTQNNWLHAEIWRLGAVPATSAVIARHRKEIAENNARLSTLVHLIAKAKLAATRQ